MKFYVYVLYIDSRPVYVGKGQGNRYSSSKSYLAKKNKINVKQISHEIIFRTNDQNEAISKEQEVIEKLSETFELYNRHKPSVVKSITYDEMSKLFYVSSKSKSFLCYTKNGKQAGGITGKNKQYYKVGICGKYYQVHRIVWCLIKKEDVPIDLVVDHIDGNSLNNNPMNLRLTNQQTNTLNRKMSEDNGVQWLADKNSWRATWYENGVQRSKTFNPKILYPNESNQIQLAKSDAMNYRNSKTDFLYSIQTVKTRKESEMENVMKKFVKSCKDFNNISSESLKFDREDLQNQYRLLEEEVSELVEALEKQDKEEMLDAVIDILVIVVGLAQKLENAGYDVSKAMKKVATNNLTKHVSSEKIANESVAYYKSIGVEVRAVYNDVYAVWTLLDTNNKVRKPLGYVSVDLSDCVPKE